MSSARWTSSGPPGSDQGVAAIQGVTLLAAIVALMWVVEIINSIDSYRLDATDSTRATSAASGGSSPRRSCTPSFQHLIDNTIPFVFMGVIIALRGAAAARARDGRS